MPKRHNAKLSPIVIRERIVNALANGDSKAQIAKGLRVSRNTVSAVAEQEWNKVEQRKGRIAAQAKHAATRAFERINNKLDSPDDIPLNILVPVTGFSVNKTLALRGEPTMVARIDHVHSGNISKPTSRFGGSQRASQPKADQPSTAQPALPNSEPALISKR